MIKYLYSKIEKLYEPLLNLMYDDLDQYHVWCYTVILQLGFI